MSAVYNFIIIILISSMRTEAERASSVQIYGPTHTTTSLLPSYGTRDPVVNNRAHLNRKRDPSLMKSDRFDLPFPGARSRKNAWCSTAHFQRCLQVLALSNRKTKVCSCSRPCQSSTGFSFTWALVTPKKDSSQHGGNAGEQGLPGHHPPRPPVSVCSS